MLKHLIILANLTLVFGHFGKRKDKLKWDHTPEQCEIKVEYGDLAWIYYKVYKKLEGVDGYETTPFDHYSYDVVDAPTERERIQQNESYHVMELNKSQYIYMVDPFFVHVRMGASATKFYDGIHYRSKGFEIRDLDEGIIGMCIGEKRTLYIPKHMMYVLDWRRKTPGFAVKVEVELAQVTTVQIGRGLRTLTAFRKLDLDKDGFLNKDEIEEHIKPEFYKQHPNAGENDFQRSWVMKWFGGEDINKDKYLSFEEWKVVGGKWEDEKANGGR